MSGDGHEVTERGTGPSRTWDHVCCESRLPRSCSYAAPPNSFFLFETHNIAQAAACMLFNGCVPVYSPDELQRLLLVIHEIET